MKLTYSLNLICIINKLESSKELLSNEALQWYLDRLLHFNQAYILSQLGYREYWIEVSKVIHDKIVSFSKVFEECFK